MNPIKIKFTVECPLRKPQGIVTRSDMELVRDFPFLPRKGDDIAVTKGGYLFEVRYIYWSDEEGFNVVLKPDDGGGDNVELKLEGWTEV